MSLQRELLVLLLSFLSLVFFFRAGTLFLEQHFVIASTHPLLVQAEESAAVYSEAELEQFPSRIEILERGVSAALLPSAIIEGNWQVNAHSASLLVHNGNLLADNGFIVYGHNSAGIFGALPKVQQDDVITVSFADGRSLRYRVTKTAIVPADQLNVLEYAGTDRILVYTCVGFLDRERFVVIGERE